MHNGGTLQQMTSTPRHSQFICRRVSLYCSRTPLSCLHPAAFCGKISRHCSIAASFGSSQLNSESKSREIGSKERSSDHEAVALQQIGRELRQNGLHLQHCHGMLRHFSVPHSPYSRTLALSALREIPRRRLASLRLPPDCSMAATTSLRSYSSRAA